MESILAADMGWPYQLANIPDKSCTIFPHPLT